jgi:hypothetical protein
MDEILQKVKNQLEAAKLEAVPKRPPKKKQFKPKSKNEPALNNSPIKKSIGTFGTAQRTLFPHKKPLVDYISSPDQPPKVLGGYISKLPRELPKPSSQDPVQPLNPNYNLNKKKTPAPIISAKPYKPAKIAKSNLKIPEKPIEYKVSEEIDQIMHSVSTADTEFEEFFKAKQIWTESLQKNIEENPNLNKIVFPEATSLYNKAENAEKIKKEKFPGPGTYLPNYSIIEHGIKGVKFAKGPRMPEQKAIETLPLFPNYDLVLKTPAGFRYVPESEKTPQQLLKEAEDEEREAMRSILYKMQNFEIPESQKQRIVGGVISPYVEPVPSRFVNDRLGPGKYDPNFYSIEPDIWGNVKYNEPMIEEEVNRFIGPGPGHYLRDEESEKNIIGGFIPESPRSKSPVTDIRPPLDPNFDFLKPKIPSAHIDPEGFTKPTEINPIGPGKYTPSYTLVEKRSDIDVLPFVQTKEKPEIPDDRHPLFINESQTKPGIPGFLYKDPVQIVPAHLPDSYFAPEQWKFYDRNEEIRFDRAPQISFAPTPYENFPEYEKDQEILARINLKLRGEWNNPTVGSYDPDPITTRVPAYDFGKVTSRDPTYSEDIQDDDKEGDILILNPEKKYKVPMLVNMEKSTGRDTIENEDEYETELLLDPKFEVLQKKVPMFVNMGKNLGRLEKIEEEDEHLILEPNYEVGKKRIISLVNMEKQPAREPEVLEAEEMVVVEEKIISKKPPRSGVNMKKMTGREEEAVFEEDIVIVGQPEGVVEKVKKNIQVPNFSKMTGRYEEKEPDLECEVQTDQHALINYENLYKAVDPEPRGVNFKRFIGRSEEIVEDLSDVPFVHTGKKY